MGLVFRQTRETVVSREPLTETSGKEQAEGTPAWPHLVSRYETENHWLLRLGTCLLHSPTSFGPSKARFLSATEKPCYFQLVSYWGVNKNGTCDMCGLYICMYTRIYARMYICMYIFRMDISLLSLMFQNSWAQVILLLGLWVTGTIGAHYCVCLNTQKFCLLPGDFLRNTQKQLGQNVSQLNLKICEDSKGKGERLFKYILSLEAVASLMALRVSVPSRIISPPVYVRVQTERLQRHSSE